jgi:C4-dicarboxylate-specific signal transduction histidine kinase
MRAITVNSRLARRLALLFTSLVALPIALSLPIIGHFERQQVIWTARTLNAINNKAIYNAQTEFHLVGRDAIRQFCSQTIQFSTTSLRKAMSDLGEQQQQTLETASQRGDRQISDWFHRESQRWREAAHHQIQTAYLQSDRLLERVNAGALKDDERSEEFLRQARAALRRSRDRSLRELDAHLERIRLEGLAQLREEKQKRLVQLRQTTLRQTSAETLHIEQAIRQRAEELMAKTETRMDNAARESSLHLTEQTEILIDEASRQISRRLSIIAMIIVLICCLSGALLAAVISRDIVNPVVRLAQASHGIAQGETSRRVEENAPDEIGDLARAFNTMAESLHTSREELRETEAQLVHSAKLASLGTLASGVAHELNQPVAIIRGIVQQLDLEPQLPESVRNDLYIIEGQTSRMMKIIRHLGVFSRMGTEEMTRVDVNRVVEGCFILIGQQLRAHDIDLELNLCREKAEVWGDASELEQVFINLLINARDALDGQPDARIWITSRLTGGQYVIEFRDNGPGVPPEIAQHIFDPFFTTKEPGKGTGLGLSISHGILQKHHGSIRVSSRGGAVFTITLPLAQPGETHFPLQNRSEAA